MNVTEQATYVVERDSVTRGRKLRVPIAWTLSDLILKYLVENSFFWKQLLNISRACVPCSYALFFMLPRLADTFLASSFYFTSAYHVPSFQKVLLPLFLFVFGLWHDPQGLDPHLQPATELFSTVNRPCKGRIFFEWEPNPSLEHHILQICVLRQQVSSYLLFKLIIFYFFKNKFNYFLGSILTNIF